MQSARQKPAANRLMVKVDPRLVRGRRSLVARVDFALEASRYSNSGFPSGEAGAVFGVGRSGAFTVALEAVAFHLEVLQVEAGEDTGHEGAEQS